MSHISYLMSHVSCLISLPKTFPNEKRPPYGDLFVYYRFNLNNALLADLLLKCGIIKPKIGCIVRNHRCNLLFCCKNSNNIYKWKKKTGLIKVFVFLLPEISIPFHNHNNNRSICIWEQIVPI